MIFRLIAKREKKKGGKKVKKKGKKKERTQITMTRSTPFSRGYVGVENSKVEVKVGGKE